ncbi:hypothetical protein BJ993_002076 [Nocardioides aromaticivorans]|uniref:Fenitrothion hydrolase n=1 Tax=Nocardioides aromaticivorans TaxID=200618 RepID=A0A7Y9ZK78_9ACTN|nr:hypothetical protein [Nocardioides aromaticivorans]NYI44996.1 hypothetical protein [Nocardioides aromaticivorans]
MRALTEAVSRGEILAHGIGGRSDLPVAPWLATYAGVAVVAVSFFVATALWAKPRWEGRPGEARLDVLGRIVDSALARASARTLGVLLLVGFLVVGWMGPDDLGRANPAPTWFYAWFWVGLVPLSLLFGPVWKRLNPLRTIASAASILNPAQVRLPQAVGMWPAVVGLVAFLWLELVYDGAASPRTVAWFVFWYAVVQVVAGVVFGPRWFERGDGFEVYSTMVSRASPWGRDAHGRLVLRNPMRGIAETPASPALTPVVVTVLGSTVFDGISRSSWWAGRIADTTRAEYLLVGTVGLAGAIAAVGATFGLAVALTRGFVAADRANGRGVAALFAPSLIPIAIGYTFAHYLSFAIFQGQQGYLLANDPLGRGWDLLGLTGRTVDYTIVTTSQIAFLQIAAIVVGHVVAVLSAHDRSLAVLRRGDGMRGQYPLVLVMIAYTGGGIVLLAGG